VSDSGYQPLNPVQVEQKLRQCVTDLYAAEKQLAEARDAETNAELAYRRYHRQALLSDDCPKVTRGGCTVTERDAWVEEKCAQWFEHYRMAQTRSQAAQDHVRTVRDVASAVQSIASLVRQAYSMGGANG
jgi:hypothetical protein